jgi:hypothetical protein
MRSSSRCEARFGRHVKLLDHPILRPLTATQFRRLHLVHGQPHYIRQFMRRTYPVVGVASSLAAPVTDGVHLYFVESGSGIAQLSG